jgi:hypothetical protein
MCRWIAVTRSRKESRTEQGAAERQARGEAGRQKEAIEPEEQENEEAM